MKEYLLYGIAPGETREYMATLLATTTDKNEIDLVKQIAARDGWHSFRESTYNGEAPNFTKALNV
jgi:hypothetical protein